MNRLRISLMVVAAICCFHLPAYSQVYVTDVNTDRASVTAAPPNVLGLLPVGANYRALDKV